MMLHDFQRLDALESADWSALLPDPRVRAFVADVAPGCVSLSEFVARWACAVVNGYDDKAVAASRTARRGSFMNIVPREGGR